MFRLSSQVLFSTTSCVVKHVREGIFQSKIMGMEMPFGISAKREFWLWRDHSSRSLSCSTLAHGHYPHKDLRLLLNVGQFRPPTLRFFSPHKIENSGEMVSLLAVHAT